MTLQQLRDFVRTHSDADTTDAPDGLLDVYARIGYNDILARRNSWPHLNVEYTFTTVNGQDRYAFSGFSTNDLELVAAVIDSTNFGRRLIYMSQSDADLAFGQPLAIKSEVATAYSVVDDEIVLYPTPGVGGKQYTVRGVRKAAVWPSSAGSVPDLPEPLHEAIAWFMLSNYFLSQEDTQLAGVYLNEYNAMVDRFTKNESVKEFSGRPLVMGGQNFVQPTFTRWVRGMLE